MTEKVAWKRAEEPVPLDVGLATRFLSTWLAGRRVARVAWMDGGLTNRNYLLELDGPPIRCVLRFYVREAAAAAREIAVLLRLGPEVPVPRVLFAEQHPEDGHPPFAVLSFVEGVSLLSLRRSGDAAGLAEACHDVGRVLARIGRYSGPVADAETLEAVLDRLLQSSTFRDRAGKERADRVARLAGEWTERVGEACCAPTLVHGDFNSANLLVASTPEGWRVKGVLDWEFALAGSPYCDIGNFLRYHRADRPRYEPDFSRGLRDEGVDLPPDWLMLARVCDLPALCELLGRPDVPGPVISELLALIDEAAPP
jgi:aminoglycoside phosphotransferase (APT) family kinase protein